MANFFHYQDPYPDNQKCILLLHGLGTDSTSWGMQFASLGLAGFRPIAPDIVGFGGSAYDGRGWSFERVASLLRNFVVDLGVAPVHVVGLSMGGVIAQQFVIDYPDLVNKVVLASTFSSLTPANLNHAFYLLLRLVVVHTVGLNAQAKIVARRIFPEPDQAQWREIVEKQIALADPRAYRAAVRSLGLFNSTRLLQKIQKPVLVISGAEDTTVSLKLQRQLAGAINGAVHHVIPNGGHAVSVDHPDEFNKALVAFLLSEG